jgi:hypothetical protein
MRKIYAIFIIPGALLALGLHGQDMSMNARPDVTRTNCLKVSVGSHQVEEELLLPKVHRGYLLNFSYNRDRLSQERLSSFLFELGYSRVKIKYEPLPATVFVSFLFQYDYSFLLAGHDKFRYFLGPLGRLNYSFAMYPMWDDSHMYWGNYMSFGARNTFIYKISPRKNLLAKVEIPVVSIASRPPSDRLYKIDDTSFGGIMSNMHSDLNAGSVETVFFLSTDVDYQFGISQKTMESVGFSVQYLRIKNRNSESFQDLYYLFTFKIYF